MKDRSGAKKLYKANKTWIAAGIAAATLFSVSALGGNTVSADIMPSSMSWNQLQAAVAKAILTLRLNLQSEKLRTQRPKPILLF